MSQPKSKTVERYTWQAMKRRTINPRCHNYSSYGGRGIKVCDEWMNSFAAFYAHIGPRPGPEYTLDRIDNNGDYEPGNVRWALRSEQARNMRRNVMLTYKGETHCVKDWEVIMGFEEGLILNRIRRGWVGDRLFIPVRPHKPYEWLGKYRNRNAQPTQTN